MHYKTAYICAHLLISEKMIKKLLSFPQAEGGVI